MNTICWVYGCNTQAVIQIMGTFCCVDHTDATWTAVRDVYKGFTPQQTAAIEAERQARRDR